MPKPSEFYIGLLDFFAVLLPGAIATVLVMPFVAPRVFGPIVPMPTNQVAGWAAFLICAYFIGHIVFLVGSWLDSRVYDPIRRRRNPYHNESAYRCAERIRDKFIGADERAALNTFQWARSVLVFKCPAAADDVHRLEADSKFFRSLLVVSAVAFMTFAARGWIVASVIALALVPLCFARYYERRLKSTTQAYLHIVTLFSLGSLPPPGQGGAAGGSPVDSPED